VIVIDEKLIIGCLDNDRSSQRKVYDLIAGQLYYTCKRYLQRDDEAEDALTEACYLIFTKIDQLKEPKAFFGWAKRITVNHCLSLVRKKVNFKMHLDEELIDFKISQQPTNELEEEDLLNLVSQLPIQSRTVFNLFAVEGFSHKEIAEKLDISVGTSKSQLSYARKKLQSLVQNFFYLKSELQ